eukprot:IDg16099t1
MGSRMRFGTAARTRSNGSSASTGECARLCGALATGDRGAGAPAAAAAASARSKSYTPSGGGAGKAGGAAAPRADGAPKAGCVHADAAAEDDCARAKETRRACAPAVEPHCERCGCDSATRSAAAGACADAMTRVASPHCSTLACDWGILKSVVPLLRCRVKERRDGTSSAAVERESGQHGPRCPADGHSGDGAHLIACAAENAQARTCRRFAMPQSGTGVSVEAVDPVFQTKMLEIPPPMKQTGRPEMVVGWYHSHPSFGCWLSGVDINTQQSFEQLNPRAVAVVIDPIQSVKGKVVIDAFRLINAQMHMLGQEPRQTTSNVGHLHKPSIQALIHGLNRHYYSIAIAYRKNELEEHMLLNLHKK